MRNRLLILLGVLALCNGLIFAKATKPSVTPLPKVAVKQDLVCRTKQQDLELRDWIVGIQNEAHKAEADLAAAKASNDQSKQEATNLANENAKARDIVKEINRYWGLGAFWYGIKRLMTHILVFAVLLLIIFVLLAVFVPATTPVIGGIGKLFGGIFARIGAIFKPKPPTSGV